MSADELGSVWNSDPVRVAQSIKPVGKELDREKKEHEEEESPERDPDSFELSSEHEELNEQLVKINKHSNKDDELIPGSHLDVTIG